MNSKRRLVLLAAIVLSPLAGCTSIRSVMLERNPCNTGWEKERHLPGVPITLKVPTHLQVAVVEKHFLTLTSVGGVEQISRLPIDVPLRGVSVDFIRTEKIFTVDFKRPAAGTMDLNLDFKADAQTQYFQKIQHKVTDETIARVTDLVGKLAPGGLFKPAAGGENVDAKVKEIDSIVAMEVFALDDPQFEMKLAEFLHCHLNKAHDAWVIPPGASGIRRLPLTGDVADQHLCGPACISHQVSTQTPEGSPADGHPGPVPLIGQTPRGR